MNQCTWQAIPGLALHHREWNDEFVLYNNLSGDTHLLDAGAMQLLRAVAAEPGDAAGIAERLRRVLGLDQQEVDEIPVMLDELAALSLIEPLQC